LAATRRLISPTRKAGQEVKRIFTRLKPEISVDLAEQTISASLGIESEQPADSVPLLVDVLDGVEKLAQKVSAPVQTARWRVEAPHFKRWLIAQARKAGMIPPRA
jgi:hypothetical protein